MIKKLCVVLSFVMVFASANVLLAQGPDGEGRDDLSDIKERIEERKQKVEELRNYPELASERQEKPLEEKVFVQGSAVDFDVPPVMEEGRTLMPVRAVSEALDASVDWIAEEDKVVIERDGKTIEMVLGETEVTVNGNIEELEVPGQAQNGRTLVPLRFISEILGDRVDYHSETGEIDIGLDFTPPGHQDEDPDEDVQKSGEPTEIVESYWASYQSGDIDSALENVHGDMQDEIDLGIGLEQMTEDDEKILQEFELEALDYEVDADDSEQAFVQIEFTKPVFLEVLETYAYEATEVLVEMQEEGASEEEMDEKADELMKEIILEVDKVSYEEQVELRLEKDAWKIYELNFENMENRWTEVEEEL